MKFREDQITWKNIFLESSYDSFRSNQYHFKFKKKKKQKKDSSLQSLEKKLKCFFVNKLYPISINNNYLNFPRMRHSNPYHRGTRSERTRAASVRARLTCDFRYRKFEVQNFVAEINPSTFVPASPSLNFSFVHINAR